MFVALTFMCTIHLSHQWKGWSQVILWHPSDIHLTVGCASHIKCFWIAGPIVIGHKLHMAWKLQMSFWADKQGGRKQSRVANKGWIESASTTHMSVQVTPLLGSMPIWCPLGMDHSRAYGELVALLRLQCCPSPTVGVSYGKETTQKQQWSNGMGITIDKQTFCHLRSPLLHTLVCPSIALC